MNDSQDSSVSSIPIPTSSSENYSLEPKKQKSAFSNASDLLEISPSSASDSSTSSRKQAKKLGVMDGAKFLVSYVVGAGIFTTVGGVHGNIGNMWLTLLLWISCGFLCLVGALCYAELASILPGSGGEHIYMKFGYGEVGMHMFDWMSFVLMRPAGVAFYAINFAKFFTQMFMNRSMSAWETFGYSSGFVLAITIFSIFTPNLFDKAQKFFTMTKVVGLLSVVVLGIGVLCVNSSLFVRNVQGNSIIIKPFNKPAQSFSDAILTFDGFNAINSIYDRFFNPIVVIPQAIMYGTSFIILIYLFVVFSYFFIQVDFTPANSGTVFQSIMKEFCSPDLVKGQKIGTWVGNPVILVAVFSATQAAISSSVDTFESAVSDNSLPSWLMTKSELFGTHYVMFALQSLIAIVCIGVSVGLQSVYNLSPSGSSDNSSQLTVLPFCVFYVLSVFVLIKDKFAKNRIQNNGYKVHNSFPYIFVLATSVLIILILVLNFKDGFSEANYPPVIVSVIVVGFFLLFWMIALLLEKKEKTSSEKANLGEDKVVNGIEELDKTALIPPSVVENALFGSNDSN